MNITPNEISEITEIGTLDGNPVKMIRCKGGFLIACGKVKGKFKDEALAAGSHPAIVRYNLEKMYPSFQATMMKSETEIEPLVDKHSHFLTDELRKSGHDIYSVHDGNEIDFFLTHQGIDIAHVNTEILNSILLIKKIMIPKNRVAYPNIPREMSSALIEKSNDLKLSKLRFKE